MGLFSGTKAIVAIQKIKAGGTAKLSVSQIADLLVNLPDANRNLTKEQFRDVYSYYVGLKSSKEQVETNWEGYVSVAVNIIKKLDALAPYEKYCGAGELEFSSLLKEIRGQK